MSTNTADASGTGRFIAKSAANRRAAAQEYVKASQKLGRPVPTGVLRIAQGRS
ncbi:hypothetical protein [Tersicoccus phoenicis]|uniref:hypothetical protein n=1 Tax=Tersicoccus phoenicis TaxID=554083 RepID=UPI00135665B2|nr:hypothetical protein [Tersicoccus phoenicis]